MDQAVAVRLSVHLLALVDHLHRVKVALAEMQARAQALTPAVVVVAQAKLARLALMQQVAVKAAMVYQMQSQVDRQQASAKM